MERLTRLLTLCFPLLALAAGGLGYLQPESFAFVLPHVKLALGLIMFGMGATLRPEDFREVARRPREVVVGIVAQFSVMPLLAWVIARALGFSPEVSVGFLLLGACPGGTASNVIAYLARADVALSVSLTTVSTILAPVLTPLIVWALAGRWMPIEVGPLFLSIAQIVLLPVVLGVLAQRWAAPLIRWLLPILPLFSIVVIVAVVGAVIGKSAELIAQVAFWVLLGVALHNGLGLLLGHAAGRFANMPEKSRRTLAIEVGMQNSGLAAALAIAHFSPQAAVPAALFSAWHNLTGPALAAWWSRKRA
jgi:BASS family bile acid:Na+ symporter